MTKRKPTAPIYPDLSEVQPPEAQPAQSYRLGHIAACQKYLETEREARSAYYKKYKRSINVVDTVDTGLTVGSVAFGSAGVGLVTTIVAIPIAMPLAAVAIGCGILSVAGKYTSRRLRKKAKKHDEIRILAESKLNTISELISAALVDGNVSDEEFKLVISECKKYEEMKNEIKARTLKAIELTEETKKNLIQQGKNEVLQKLAK